MSVDSPPDWHPDPFERFDLRFWDGHRWTEWVCDDGGEPYVEAMAAPPPPPVLRVQDTPERETREWTRRELNELEDRAGRAIGQLENRHRRLADLVQQAPRELRQAFQQHVDRRRWEIFAEQPLDRLREHGERIPLAVLERTGMDMAGMHAQDAIGFESIKGVGATGAAQLKRAVASLREWAYEQPVAMPRPDQIDRSHEQLLRAAARELRARSVPSGLVPQLEAAVEALREEAETLDKQRSRIRRLFGRGGTQEQIAETADDLVAELDSAIVFDLTRRADATLASSRIPERFDELLREYTDRFAEYTSVLEQTVTELGGAGDTIVANARGGLPAQVAARIEACDLDLTGLGVHLRAYQHFGTQFMIEQARVVVGDEMGLGKTIQALAAMTHLSNSEHAERFIVVAPASILANWEREIARRTDFRLWLLHGSDRDQAMTQWLRSGGVALTSYATLRAIPRLEEIAVDLLVADEAHYAKNPESKRTQAVERLSRHATRIVLMSGTPIENDLDDFANLLELANPGFMRRLPRADRRSGTGGMPSRAEFRHAVAPVYLRRNQEDVLTELPERLEVEEWVELTADERSAYRQGVRRGQIMQVRQAAIFGAGVSSAKYERVEELLEQYRQSGEKVVIFSYFIGALDALQEMVPESYRIDGSASPEGRLDTVDRFGSITGHAVLVAQITSGGVGLNLQAASVVILMEPQFKPSTEWQAIARAHRMGQARRVMVHRLLARNTIDESLYEMVVVKAKIFDTYARESLLKDVSAASVDLVDDGLVRRLMVRETERLQDTLV